MAQQLYRYKAWDRSGNLVSGTIDIDDPEKAADRLRVQGYFLSSLVPAKKGTSSVLFSRKKRISAKGLAIFCRQFSIMIQTGMQVVPCLQTLADQQSEASVREALEEVRRQVAGGEGLAESFNGQSEVFPQMFIDMIHMGEMSGNLSEVLDRLAIYYEKDAKLRGDVKQALTYPTVIIAFAFVAIGVVLFFVLPTFAGIFADFDAELPFITQVVLGLRDMVIDNALYVSGGLVATYLAIRMYVRSEQGKRNKDKLLLRIPVVGELIRKIIFSRFSRTLALLFVSGVSTLKSLEVCERIVGNQVVAEDVAKCRIGVERGRGISEPLRETETFPGILVEMIAVGEETGDLDRVLEQVSAFYDREVEQTVNALTSIIEPIILVFVAGIIGIIVVSVFMPMFNLMNVF